jgi:hypothetical protein
MEVETDAADSRCQGELTANLQVSKLNWSGEWCSSGLESVHPCGDRGIGGPG